MSAIVFGPSPGSNEENDHENCAICLDPVSADDVKACSADHRYHEACLARVRSQAVSQGKQPRCPTCRKPVLSVPEAANEMKTVVENGDVAGVARSHARLVDMVNAFEENSEQNRRMYERIRQDEDALKQRSLKMLVRPDVEFARQEAANNIEDARLALRVDAALRAMLSIEPESPMASIIVDAANGAITMYDMIDRFKESMRPLIEAHVDAERAYYTFRARIIGEELARDDLREDYRREITGWAAKTSEKLARLNAPDYVKDAIDRNVDAWRQHFPL